MWEKQLNHRSTLVIDKSRDVTRTLIRVGIFIYSCSARRIASYGCFLGNSKQAVRQDNDNNEHENNDTEC